MQMTRERYQSAQEEKKQLTLKVEELERLEILGSLNLPFPPSSLYFFQEIETASVLFQSSSMPPGFCAFAYPSGVSNQ